MIKAVLSDEVYLMMCLIFLAFIIELFWGK